MVAAFNVNAGAGTLAAIPKPVAASENGPAYVAIDRTGRTLVVADYHDAVVAAVAVRDDGSVGEPRAIRHFGRGPHPSRQTKSHPHSTMISPDNRFVLACDLGLDRIYSYRLDAERAALGPADPPFVAVEPGSGPRHLAFGRDGLHAYAINELSNTLVAYAYDPGRGSLSPLQTVSTLPPDFRGESTAAEVRVHPNGRFAYGSNRGHDSIALFAVDPATGLLTARGTIPAGGATPRNFALSPDGAWLVCAHQDSDTLCSFRVDPDRGSLTRIGGTVPVPMPVCVVFYD